MGDRRGGKLENITADAEFTTREKLLHSEFLGINIIFIGSFFGLFFFCLFVFGSLMLFGNLAVLPVPKGINLIFGLSKLHRNGISRERLWGEKCVFARAQQFCLYVFIRF